MHQRHRVGRSPARDHGGRLGVDGCRERDLVLSLVHGGVRRGIDDKIWLQLVELRGESIELGEVELDFVRRDHRSPRPQQRKQRAANLSLRAGQKDAHQTCP